MSTLGEVTDVTTVQKWGQIFQQKGLTNPPLKRYFERAYQICRWAVLRIRDDKSVKKRQGPKMGTLGEVTDVTTIQKRGQIFQQKGLTNPSLKRYSERAYQICQ